MKLSQIGTALFGVFMSFNVWANYSCEQLNLTDCPTPVDQKLPDPHNMLTWTSQDRVIGFRNTFKSYDGTVDLLRKLMSIHPIDPRGDQIHP